MALPVNTQAPDFTLHSTSGKKFQLSKDAERKSILLYFYPKDFTPACTKEACSFKDNFDVFKDLDVDIVGISTDPVKQHLKFKEMHQLPFELLSDATGEVSKAYEAHVPILNISKRVTYLLDNDHRVVASYSDLFGAERHIQKMLSNLQKL
ncbi:MAG: peroxiredoxin [Cytophagales bacterium]|nr:peroxiredoxin [Cytophagales bacterium]